MRAFPNPFPGSGGGQLLPSLTLNFLGSTLLDSRVTSARASTATDGKYTDTSGSFNSFATNVPRLSAASGLLIEESRANSLLNSGAPVTQTTTSIITGSHCLWIEGTGTATSSAGTAVGTGFGAATAGSPNVFTMTGAGTVTVTLSGSVSLFQLELGAYSTSYIPTAGAQATRAKDIVTMPVGSWFNPNAGTLVVEALLPSGPVNPTNQCLVELSDLTTSNRFLLARNINANTLNAFYEVGGVTAANLTTTFAVTPGSVFKAGFSASAGGFLTAANGVADISSGAAGSPLTAATTLCIGERGTGISEANGYIHRILYWPRALGQAELNQVTL